MADWQKIKTEYITTDTSYRKLAQKHGVHYNAIANRAKQEDWISQRNQFCDRTVTKTVTAISNKQVDRAVRLKTVADKLLDKVEQYMDTDIPITAAALKNLSDAIRNIKEAQMIRTEEDIEEQKARIAKLHMEANPNQGDNVPKLVVEGLPEEFKV